MLIMKISCLMFSVLAVILSVVHSVQAKEGSANPSGIARSDTVDIRLVTLSSSGDSYSARIEVNNPVALSGIELVAFTDSSAVKSVTFAEETSQVNPLDIQFNFTSDGIAVIAGFPFVISDSSWVPVG